MKIRLVINGQESSYENVQYFSLDNHELYIEFQTGDPLIEKVTTDYADVEVENF